mgnify:FL=1
MARVVKKAIMEVRRKGVKAGLIRPITLWPFPEEYIKRTIKTAKIFLSVEINMGQMLEDIKLVVNGEVPVDFYGRIGVNPNPEEIAEQLLRVAEREGI